MGLPFFKKKNLPKKVNQEDYERVTPEVIREVPHKYNDDKEHALRNREIDTYQQIIEAARQTELAHVEEALQYRDMYLGKMEAIRDLGNMVTNIATSAMDVWKTSKIIERDITAINAKTNIELTKIAAKYEMCQTALMGIFGERKEALQKHYQILDSALKENDREMVIVALKGVSDIVTTRPLEDFNKFLEVWNDTSNEETLKLGF